MAIVYRLCEGLLARLPVDEHGGRVFDETLADWRREARVMRGMVAVSRALLRVSVAEVATAAMGRVVLRVVVWMVLALSVSLYVWNAQILPPRGMVYSLVGCAAFFMPAALLFATSGRSRTHVPTLGPAAAGSVLAVLLMVWAVPAANQTMYEAKPPRRVTPGQTQPAVSTGIRSVARAIWPRPPIEFLSSARIPQMASEIVYSPWGGWGALQQLSFRLSFITLCLLVPFAAAALRRINSNVRRLVALWFAVTMWLYASPITAFIAPDWIFWPFVAFWIPVVPALALVATRVPAEAEASASIS